MSARYLIDTSLLVYPHDAKDTRKSARARSVLQQIATEQTGALPAQALAEFASIALRKLQPTPGVGDQKATTKGEARAGG